MVIQTLLVYISLTLLLYFAARYSAEKNTLFFIVSAIAVYSVVFAGVDRGIGGSGNGFLELQKMV